MLFIFFLIRLRMCSGIAYPALMRLLRSVCFVLVFHIHQLFFLIIFLISFLINIIDQNIHTIFIPIAFRSKMRGFQVRSQRFTVRHKSRAGFEGTRLAVPLKITIVVYEQMAGNSGVIGSLKHISGAHMANTCGIRNLNIRRTGKDFTTEQVGLYASSKGDNRYLAALFLHCGNLAAINHYFKLHDFLLAHCIFSFLFQVQHQI